VSVSECARARGVTEILHYTSNRGLMGCVMKGAVLSRERVEADPDVAFIFEGIWERKDHAWLDYISLSVARINLDLFHRSRENFPDRWWAVLSFSPDILDHEDIWFTTTNNVYEECCKRGQGLAGFEAMYASTVEWGYYGSRRLRTPAYDDAWPTDRAAEVLYPRSIPLEHLQAVYVPQQEHRRMVDAWTESFDKPELDVTIDPARFA
jgi:ssDNA thymidine ADP-ribosyltransferase, DarT